MLAPMPTFKRYRIFLEGEHWICLEWIGGVRPFGWKSCSEPMGMILLPC